MKNKTELTKQLFYYLYENDISIKELAERLNVSRGSIYNWIDGKSISNKNYIKLMKLLENYVPSEWIIETVNQNNLY